MRCKKLLHEIQQSAEQENKILNFKIQLRADFQQESFAFHIILYLVLVSATNHLEKIKQISNLKPITINYKDSLICQLTFQKLRNHKTVKQNRRREAKILEVQLEPLGVSNRDIQGSNPPLSHYNYQIYPQKQKIRRRKTPNFITKWRNPIFFLINNHNKMEHQSEEKCTSHAHIVTQKKWGAAHWSTFKFCTMQQSIPLPLKTYRAATKGDFFKQKIIQTIYSFTEYLIYNC